VIAAFERSVGGVTATDGAGTLRFASLGGAGCADCAKAARPRLGSVIANQVANGRPRLNRSEYTARSERWFERGKEVVRVWCKSCTQRRKSCFGYRQAIQRWVMTLGAISVFLLLLSQCQQDYPKPPTLCDEWCAARDRTRCADEDPAECIVVCERGRAVDVENGRPPGTCDGLRRVLMDCINTLPDSVFHCADPSRVAVELMCPHERTALSLCVTRQKANWPTVCNSWALKCSSLSRADGGDFYRLYELCSPPPYVLDCVEDQQIMVDCLAVHDLSCDVLPAENAVCEREKVALDSCHPLKWPLCIQWSDVCGCCDGPRDSGPHSLASCLATSPVDKGARCRSELDTLYQCFWSAPGIHSSTQRCDVVPLLAPECLRENEAFMACARAFDGGAY
jgi:hypothetical protein